MISIRTTLPAYSIGKPNIKREKDRERLTDRVRERETRKERERDKHGKRERDRD